LSYSQKHEIIEARVKGVYNMIEHTIDLRILRTDIIEREIWEIFKLPQFKYWVYFCTSQGC
jgi:hypothetical protein